MGGQRVLRWRIGADEQNYAAIGRLISQLSAQFIVHPLGRLGLGNMHEPLE